MSDSVGLAGAHHTTQPITVSLFVAEMEKAFKVLFQSKPFGTGLVIYTTITGAGVGFAIIVMINKFVKTYFHPSQEVRNSPLYNGTHIAVGLVPAIALNVILAKQKFLPIPLSGRTSAMIAISTLAFLGGALAYIMKYDGPNRDFRNFSNTLNSDWIN